MYLLHRSNNLPLLEIRPFSIDSVIPGVFESTSLPSYIHIKGIRRMLVSRPITPSFITHLDSTIVCEFENLEDFISEVKGELHNDSLIRAFANVTLDYVHVYVSRFLEDCSNRINSLVSDDDSLQDYSDAVVQYMSRFSGEGSGNTQRVSMNTSTNSEGPWHRQIIALMSASRRGGLNQAGDLDGIKLQASHIYEDSDSFVVERSSNLASVRDYATFGRFSF